MKDREAERHRNAGGGPLKFIMEALPVTGGTVLRKIDHPMRTLTFPVDGCIMKVMGAPVMPALAAN